MDLQTVRAETTPKSNQELIVLNGVEYVIEHDEWTTHSGQKASGYSCWIDSGNRVTSPTREGIIERIINYKKPITSGDWYGQGRYMGD